MHLPNRLIVFLFLLVLFGLSANAGIIVFSNLVQPGNIYGPDGVGIGHTPGFPTPGDYMTYAVHFIPTTTVTLSAFEAPLTVVNGPNQLQAFFMSDAGGAPGSILESYSISDVAPPPGTLVTIPSILDPVLLAGHQYWFAVTGGGQTFGIWTLNLFQGDPVDGGAGQSVINGIAQPWTMGPGTRTGALEVLGNAVPEPSYTAITGFVALLLVLVGRTQSSATDPLVRLPSDLFECLRRGRGRCRPRSRGTALPEC